MEGTQGGVRGDRGSNPTTTFTTRVPRALPDVLARAYEIAAAQGLLVLNVFHAGDGNLHPLLVFDGAEPGVMSGYTPPARRSSRRRSQLAGC